MIPKKYIVKKVEIVIMMNKKKLPNIEECRFNVQFLVFKLSFISIGNIPTSKF